MLRQRRRETTALLMIQECDDSYTALISGKKEGKNPRKGQIIPYMTMTVANTLLPWQSRKPMLVGVCPANMAFPRQRTAPIKSGLWHRSRTAAHGLFPKEKSFEKHQWSWCGRHRFALPHIRACAFLFTGTSKGRVAVVSSESPGQGCLLNAFTLDFCFCFVFFLSGTYLKKKNHS